MTTAIPHYQAIKSHIVEGIRAGRWSAGQKIPSETELARNFGLSRMTANRAVRELAAEGVLERVQGKGTFVLESPPLQSVLKIRSIAEEVRTRGFEYAARVVSLRESRVSAMLATRMSLPVGSPLWSSIVIHFENASPLQVEQRWVHPAVAPNYLDQDFQQQTPHDYLTQVAPLTRGEHTIEACFPDRRLMRWLEVSEQEPCLRIVRTTWVKQSVASFAVLTHAGSRYQLQTQFSTGGPT